MGEKNEKEKGIVKNMGKLNIGSGQMKKVGTQSTRKLLNRFLLFLLLSWGIASLCFLLGQNLQSTTMVLGSVSEILLYLGFFWGFLFGLIMFIRRENPYTLTGLWFGKQVFAKGNIPRLYGMFIMLITVFFLVVAIYAAFTSVK